MSDFSKRKFRATITLEYEATEAPDEDGMYDASQTLCDNAKEYFMDLMTDSCFDCGEEVLKLEVDVQEITDETE